MKKWTEILRKNEALLYFWRGYLKFGVLLLGCMLPLIIKTFFLLEENVETNTYKNVEKGMEILDNEISTLNSAALDIQTHKYFPYVRAVGEERNSGDFYAFLEIQKKLAETTRYLSFTRDCMLYFPEDLIFFSDNVYTIAAQDSSKRLTTSKYGTLESWFDALDDEKYSHAFLPADTYHDSMDGAFEGIAYVHSYAYGDSSENPMFIVIFPVESLLEVWRLQDLADIAGITISNGEDGDILYADDKNMSGRLSDIVINSKKSNLCVKVSIPISYFIRQLGGLIVLAAVYILAFLVIAVAVSVQMAYKNTEKHTALNDEISHWMLREQILNGLEGAQLEEFCERYRDHESPFRMMIIHLTQTRWSISAPEVKEMLAEYGVDFWFISKVKPNLFVLLCGENRDPQQLRHRLKAFMDSADRKWECECLASVGPSLSGFEELKDVYQLVWCNMKWFSEKKLLFQEDLTECEGGSYKNFNVLENVRLTDMVMSGSEASAVALIKNQWEKAREVRTDEMFLQLFFMQSTVLNSAAMKLDYDISAAGLSYDDSISSMEAKLICVAKSLCQLVSQKKEAEKNELPGKIAAFMAAHYNDPDFYMTTLVEEFNLSDKTIAKLIKSHLNMTFSEYLEELRLQKALKLLSDSSNNIRYVAAASGFGSENTFFKVFKRKFGISPSSWRENNSVKE